MAEKGYNLRPNRKNSNLNPNYEYNTQTDSESEIEEERRHLDDITCTDTEQKTHPQLTSEHTEEENNESMDQSDNSIPIPTSLFANVATEPELSSKQSLNVSKMPGDSQGHISGSITQTPAPEHSRSLPNIADDDERHLDLPTRQRLDNPTVGETATTNTTVTSAPIAPSDINTLIALMIKLDTKLSNKIDESNAKIEESNTDIKAEINSKINSKLNELKVELTQSFNDKIDANSLEIQACRNALETHILENRESQNKFQIEINSIKITQTTQAEEMIKLNQKLTQKIDESQDQMRQFVIDNLTQQQSISDNKNQQRQNDILSAVKTQLVMHEQNFDQKIEELSQRTRQESEQNSKANLAIIQNEILPKLTIQNKTLESQQAEIQNLNQNLTKCEQEVETLKQNKTFENFQGPIKIICNGNEEKDRQIPKFNGRSGNPKEYLNKLKRYYDRGLERNSNYDPIEYLKDLLETSFEGPASRWLQLVKTDLSSWEQFSNEFEAKYWSREVQRSLRAKIESEKYRSNGTLSRSEYLTERVISLQSMSPCLTEEEIVTLMAERFDSIIQDCINVQNITTVRALERLLQREDLKDGPKKTRTNNQNHNSSSNNRPTTPNQQPHTYHQNGRYENQRAYQPKIPSYHNNSYNNNHQHRNYPNHQNYRPNQNHPTYNRNHENKPYQRDRYPPHNGDYNQRRNHPTQEQAQLCAVMRQNNYVPSAPPNNQSSHSYEPPTHPAPNIQENGSAL
ncbi:TPR-containing protein DDB_G0280363-like [Macrosteles quadrilineatus]|uniref:TPR-containing protein DDB_G0280363-like n=1 Tax=Macrosteles quadrilineatus TaxID=74068 RepID=UPI0023E20EAF|nr:TPR-containing protein DDB_G0280363-like [Macrosteles quadrilineatus]